jgi:hypothetical protein
VCCLLEDLCLTQSFFPALVLLFWTKESNLESVFDVEGSSLIVTLLSDLCRALFANRLASTLIALFCMSSRVEAFLSLSWYDMSASNPSGNLINARPYGGLISVGIALYRLLKRVQ